MVFPCECVVLILKVTSDWLGMGTKTMLCSTLELVEMNFTEVTNPLAGILK